MSKTVKIIITYVLTFLAAFAVIGGTGLIIMNRYKAAQSERAAETTAETSDPIPGDIDRMIALIAYDGAARFDGVCFYIMGFVAEEDKLYIVPLHSDLEVNGRTLYDVYAEGGIVSAKDGLNNILPVTIDQYMVINHSGFNIFSEACGNISYDVPYHLINSSQNQYENTLIKEGIQILDTSNLSKVLIFPGYNNGEDERVQTMGTLTVELINAGCKSTFRSNLRDFYDQLVEAGCATNISSYDFDDVKPAWDYVLQRSVSPAQLLLPSGSYNESERYVMDADFVDALPRFFDE